MSKLSDLDKLDLEFQITKYIGIGGERSYNVAIFCVESGRRGRINRSRTFGKIEKAVGWLKRGGT